MKWLKGLGRVLTGDTGNCPDCGSDKIDYGFVAFNVSDNVGYGAVWCEMCGHGFRISRVIINEQTILKDIPDGIVYDN